MIKSSQSLCYLDRLPYHRRCCHYSNQLFYCYCYSNQPFQPFRPIYSGLTAAISISCSVILTDYFTTAVATVLTIIPLLFQLAIPTVPFCHLTNCSTTATAAISAILTVPFYALTDYSIIPTAILIIPFFWFTVLVILLLLF